MGSIRLIDPVRSGFCLHSRPVCRRQMRCGGEVGYKTLAPMLHDLSLLVHRLFLFFLLSLHGSTPRQASPVFLSLLLIVFACGRL